MNKLLSAGFRRMLREKYFWVGTAFMLAVGTFIPVINHLEEKKTGAVYILDNGFFAYTVFIAVISAVFCSLFIGTEHSDGTMRNKIIVGHKRTAVYLSNFISCVVAQFIMWIAFVLPTVCIGMPLAGSFKMETSLLFGMTLCSFLVIIALTAIFTLASMLNMNKAIAAVICILGVIVLLIVGSYVQGKLSENETYSLGYQYTADGVVSIDGQPNPNYIDGTKRKIYQFVYDFTPGGQIAQLSTMTAVNLWQMSMYSTIIIVMSTGIGIFFFKKKDLK